MSERDASTSSSSTTTNTSSGKQLSRSQSMMQPSAPTNWSELAHKKHLPRPRASGGLVQSAGNKDGSWSHVKPGGSSAEPFPTFMTAPALGAAVRDMRAQSEPAAFSGVCFLMILL